MVDAIQTAFVLPHDPDRPETDRLVAFDCPCIGSRRVADQPMMLPLVDEEPNQ